MTPGSVNVHLANANRFIQTLSTYNAPIIIPTNKSNVFGNLNVIINIINMYMKIKKVTDGAITIKAETKAIGQSLDLTLSFPMYV